jgi:hypothetical protein
MRFFLNDTKYSRYLMICTLGRAVSSFKPAIVEMLSSKYGKNRANNEDLRSAR